MKKTLICTFSLLKRHIKINALMILQIIVTLYILTGFTGQIQYLYKASGITGAFSDCEALYFFPYSNNDPKDTVVNVLKENDINDVSVGEALDIDININGRTELVTAYNSVTLEYAAIELKTGKWITEYKNTDAIPVVSADPEYCTGDRFKITDKSGVEHDAFVCGQISNDSYILSFTQSGSPSVSELSFFVSHPDRPFIVPYCCDDICSVTDEFDMFPVDNGPLSSGYGKLVLPGSIADKEQISSLIKMYGTVTDIRVMAENYDKFNRNDLMITGIILFMFSVLTITGIGGVNGLQSRINKRYYVIWYMTGLKTGECALIEFCRVAVLAVSSFICYFVIYYFTPLKEVMDMDGIVINAFTFLISFVFILLLFCITSLGYVIKLGRGNIMLNYKNQD